MAEDTGMAPGKGKRASRGFQRAGALIGAQTRTAQARRGFAQARLRALWPEIAGPEFAAVCAPLRLAQARGPAGGLLTLAVEGAQAPRLQMLLPVLRERINAALGPGTVGRIQLTHAAGGFAERPAAFERPAAAQADLRRLGSALSSIGDDELRRALETLARNVLSRARKP
jgi:hypothetical protein